MKIGDLQESHVFLNLGPMWWPQKCQWFWSGWPSYIGGTWNFTMLCWCMIGLLYLLWLWAAFKCARGRV